MSKGGYYSSRFVTFSLVHLDRLPTPPLIPMKHHPAYRGITNKVLGIVVTASEFTFVRGRVESGSRIAVFPSPCFAPSLGHSEHYEL